MKIREPLLLHRNTFHYIQIDNLNGVTEEKKNLDLKWLGKYLQTAPPSTKYRPTTKNQNEWKCISMYVLQSVPYENTCA